MKKQSKILIREQYFFFVAYFVACDGGEKASQTIGCKMRKNQC